MEMENKEETAKRYLIECLARDLVVMLIEDYGMGLEKALDVFYNSETLEKLEDSNTGLYYQGPVYVMDFLQEELRAKGEQ